MALVYKPPSGAHYHSTQSLVRSCHSCGILSLKSQKLTDCVSHPTIFVRAAGYCNNDAGSQTERKAGVGVFFGPESKRNLSEPLQRTLTLADYPGPRRNHLSTRRAEVFAAIRALDKVRVVLSRARREESFQGIGRLPAMRCHQADTIPRDVAEIVVITSSAYVAAGITGKNKSWRRSTLRRKRTCSGGSITSSSSSASASASESDSSSGGGWFSLSLKSKTVHPADYDLFRELDQVVLNLQATFGVKIYFFKSSTLDNVDASRLARQGASGI